MIMHNLSETLCSNLKKSTQNRVSMRVSICQQHINLVLINGLFVDVRRVVDLAVTSVAAIILCVLFPAAGIKELH